MPGEIRRQKDLGGGKTERRKKGIDDTTILKRFDKQRDQEQYPFTSNPLWDSFRQQQNSHFLISRYRFGLTLLHAT